MNKAEHICKPMKPTCCCWQLADEPDEDCPIHGGGIVNRCECGRYVSPTCFYVEPDPPGDPGPSRSDGKT